MEKAWAVYMPSVDLEEALRTIRQQDSSDSIPNPAVQQKRHNYKQHRHSNDMTHSTEQPPVGIAEPSNAEDYEFDESQDFDNSTDGMGLLTVDTRKAGYTGPQSGVATLKFLQSLPLYIPLSSFVPTSSLDDDPSDFAPLVAGKQVEVSRYLDDYFAFYHPAYPILHEGTFRARVSGKFSFNDYGNQHSHKLPGALAKPRDGSWPLLYNIVLAIGAFVGDSNGTKTDIIFFKEARKLLSMDVLEKGSLSYVQAIVLMANYLQKRNKPNAGFILIGIGFSMALAIGLHREFGMPSTSPFTMEIRRRVWWTLFIFVSGVQLILGRPAVSLVGVNVRLPANVDDHDLAVDMDELPENKTGPTITSSLIAQVKLAKIANAVQVELLTHHLPTYDKARDLEHRITAWSTDLPPYFSQSIPLEPRFDIPKRVLLWRSFHLRIVINRPFLFQSITSKSDLVTSSAGPIASCLMAADMCVTSICGFLQSTDNRRRGLTWYATCWLLTASFVQATCYVYEPTHPLATSWRCHIQRAVDCLGSLGSSHDMALRARDVLQKILEHGHALALPGNVGRLSPVHTPASFRSLWTPSGWRDDDLLSMGLGNSFAGYPQGSFNAEFLDAAGGLMIQNLFDNSDGRPQNNSWVPG